MQPVKRLTSWIGRAGSTLLELAGLAVFAAAAWIVAMPLGLAVVGAELVYVSYATGSRRSDER